MSVAAASPVSQERDLQVPIEPGVLKGQRSTSLSEVQKEAAAILELLVEAQDLGAFSPELMKRALEAGLWYHFNPFRTTALRALSIPPHARILEVGCGAGTVTRYLGEQGFAVVGLERSVELARCARLRCQGVRGVEIVHGDLEDLVSENRFDLVICLDPALSGADFATQGLDLFARCRRVLRSTGSMIVAVGNALGDPGGTRIRYSKDHVRGGRSALGALHDSLTSAGFLDQQTFLSFPHHAAPQVLVEPLTSRTRRMDWISMAQEVYKGSSRGLKQLKDWWRKVHSEYLDSALSPGWVVVAHAHRVHSPLWTGWGVSRSFVKRSVDQRGENSAEALKGAAYGDRDGSTAEMLQLAVSISDEDLSDGDLLASILSASAPEVKSYEDYIDEIRNGEVQVSNLSKAQRRLRSIFAHKRLLSREKLQFAKRGVQTKEAELELVLAHARSVGSMWRALRDENERLSEKVEELSERCEISRGLLQGLLGEVESARRDRSSAGGPLLRRVGAFIREFFGRKQRAR